MINKCFLVGNLSSDPELKYLPSGTALCNFSVALNSQYKNEKGEIVKEVSFIPVTVFGKIAENCTEYLKKGSLVTIQAKLKQERWTNEEGKNRSAIKIIAELVQFNGKKNEENAEEKAQNDSDIPF